MDRFAWGAIILAVIIEGFLIWGNLKNPQEVRRNLIVATMLPVVLIGTVVLFYRLQKGET